MCNSQEQRTKELSSELEIGGQRTWSRQDGVKDNSTELLLTLGFRGDFYADDSSRNADKRNCEFSGDGALPLQQQRRQERLRDAADELSLRPALRTSRRAFA